MLAHYDFWRPISGPLAPLGFVLGILSLGWGAWLLIPITVVAALMRVKLVWLLVIEFLLNLLAAWTWSISAGELQNDLHEGALGIFPVLAGLELAIQLPIYYVIVRRISYRQVSR